MSDNEQYDEVEAIGWDAIDAALAPIYGGREPKHYGTVLPAMLGGKDPLQGISVYKNLPPEPHYHNDESQPMDAIVVGRCPDRYVYRRQPSRR